MNHRRGTVVAVVAAALVAATTAVPAAAVERTVDLRAGGSVRIEVPAGAVRIVGADRDGVAVTGSVGFDPEILRVVAEGGRVSVEVPVEDGARSGADLVVRVPRSLGSLEVEGLTCDVAVEGVEAAAVRIEVVRGDLVVGGDIGRLDVETVSGSVRVAGAVVDARVEAAAGRIAIAGVRETVSAETVSGPIEVVAAAPLRHVALSTANGEIRFEGGLTAAGRLRAESINGGVELALDLATRAAVEVETFNGRLDVEWPGVDAGAPGAGPGRTARFALGGGGDARIEVDTFNGRCRVRPR